MFPVFCPEDPNGPVSQEEAIRLLKITEKHFLEVLSVATKSQDFDYANGAQQALSWAIDLVKRLTIDPQMSKDALKKSADFLEREAQELRRRAEK